MKKAIPVALLSALILAGTAFAVQIPRPAGEVPIQLPNGKQDLLSKYRGKVVVLGFILTT